ncbi:NAD(P)/FAD-dependent oxidoreductase [Nonomuraea endophytica]|uniref:NAD(P)/FAD-dependent oxidoreductase n=1 Tax=Nonomuraea endophytica TaxID=714136 RepID=UPI0037C847B3
MTQAQGGARVVVAGGGVIGLSVAVHLARAGVPTMLLERGHLGSGASKATADVLRGYFAGNPVSSAMATRSLAAYQAFAELTGTALPMRQVGYLVLFSEPAQVAAFEAELPAQRAAGVDIELISEAQARRRNPLIGDIPLCAAAWSPQAYISDTTAIVEGFAAAARQAGVTIRTNCAVTALDTATGRIETTAGTFTAETVVCAAGAWSAPIARCAGVDLPLGEPVVQELLSTEVLPPVPEIPVTLHAASGLLVRLRGDRLLIGMGYPGQDREAWRERVAARLAEIYPSLAGAALHTAVIGTRDASPDRTPFIGCARSASDRPAFLYAAGFSGHGLCVAPAAGELVAGLYMGREAGFDAHRLAATPERV